MNITNLFFTASEKYPDKIAIYEKNSSISYRQLAKEVKATAAYFRKAGIRPGDRVLVFVPMSIDLYRVVLALFYIGATAVFLDAWVSKKRMEVCCQLADCKGFIGIFKARVLSWFSRDLRNIPIKLKLNGKIYEETTCKDLPPESPALITFTTGSTGIPKAANRTHEFLNHQFDALREVIQPKPDDVDMPVLPIVLFLNLGIGCTSVIASYNMKNPEKTNINKIVSEIKERKVNRITASPFLIETLAKHLIKTNQKLPNVQKIFTGGAPVFPVAARYINNAFPYSKNTIVYGSTEAEPISLIDAGQVAAAEGEMTNGLPVGKIDAGLHLRIIPVNTDNISNTTKTNLNNLTLTNGKVGEIIVAGTHVLKNYFKNEKAFAENKIVTEDKIWHRTGDSGFVKNGELFLTGRCKQLIVEENKIISPFLIENKLQGIPGVSSGTILQIKEALVLVVSSDLKPEKIKPALEDIPYDKFIVVHKIPKDPRHHSKIDYEELKNMIKV